ncbi:uncharacterized protein [Amphiura filiformis]|uniref:uncharacterized protein isoform X2 n=1 Tax=Amphiura filiformis TaxID=82378 RepID=UPI003B222CE7
MGVKQKIYGFAVFTATCMLVFSYPKLHGGRRDATNPLRYVSSRLHRRSIHEPAEDVAAAASSDDDHPGQSATMMWSSLLITGLITAALVLVLALCTCGKKSKSNNQASSPDEEEIKPEETNEVTQQPVGNGYMYMYMTPWGRQKITVAPSSPVVMTVDSPITPRTPSPEMRATREPFTPISPNGGAAVQVHSPPSPTFDMADIPYADAVSISPQHQPTRGATINRRLPQLPQSPPPAVPDGDDTEKDYDLTYDVIPEKRKDATPIDDMYDKGGGYERLRDTKANGLVMPSSDHVDAPYAKVDEGRKKKPVVELETTDHNYNSIEETRGGGGGAGKRSPPLAKPDLEIDGHYASVGDDEEKDGVYARVKDRSREGVDRSNGYARVRDVQNGGPTTASSSSELMSGDGVTATRVSPLASHRSVELAEDEEDEDDDVPPAIPEKMPDLENGMDIKPVSPATHTQRLPSVGNSPGPSHHADRTSPAPPGSPQLINSQSGLAASIAAGTAAVANDQQDGQQNNTTPSNVQVKEKPYTQVSARESLEFVRARQQAEHTACSMAHYEFISENDYDGISETVNEGQMSRSQKDRHHCLTIGNPGPSSRLLVHLLDGSRRQ